MDRQKFPFCWFGKWWKFFHIKYRLMIIEEIKYSNRRHWKFFRTPLETRIQIILHKKVIKSMEFQRIHRDWKYKFEDGHWTWNEQNNELKFQTRSRQVSNEDVGINLLHGNYLKFKREMSDVEEEVFRKYFQRKEDLPDVIILKDVKNLALFTLKTKISKDFISFVLSENFDLLLHSAVFYMDYFLMILELLLIRRDEIKEGKVRDFRSIKIEKTLSRRLSHRRLLLSREYSKVNHTIDNSVEIL